MPNTSTYEPIDISAPRSDKVKALMLLAHGVEGWRVHVDAQGRLVVFDTPAGQHFTLPTNEATLRDGAFRSKTRTILRHCYDVPHLDPGHWATKLGEAAGLKRQALRTFVSTVENEWPVPPPVMEVVTDVVGPPAPVETYTPPTPKPQPIEEDVVDDEDTIEVDEAAEELREPAYHKRRSPIRVACPRCGAMPGDSCVKIINRNGLVGEPLRSRGTTTAYHQERRDSLDATWDLLSLDATPSTPTKVRSEDRGFAEKLADAIETAINVRIEEMVDERAAEIHELREQVNALTAERDQLQTRLDEFKAWRDMLPGFGDNG